MRGEARPSRFSKFAWTTLGFNLLVILWGVFLRASKSGDGCGQYWLTCHGEFVPSAPELKTVIEFTHRVSSGIAFLLVSILLIWAFREFRGREQIRKTALLSFVFILTEAIIGGILVLTGNTAGAVTAERPVLAVGHLINSFILLGFLALTAWLASSGRGLELRIGKRTLFLLLAGVIVILLAGTTGSLAALGGMLSPSETLSQGLAKDFSPTSDFLLRLRLSHPILSILAGVYLVFLAGWLKVKSGNEVSVSRWSGFVSILVLAQLVFGAATLLTLSPILMQVGHLLLADLVWIAFVLLAANFLTTVPAAGGSPAPSHLLYFQASTPRSDSPPSSFLDKAK